jgi:hypothetical protein
MSSKPFIMAAVFLIKHYYSQHYYGTVAVGTLKGASLGTATEPPRKKARSQKEGRSERKRKWRRGRGAQGRSSLKYIFQPDFPSVRVHEIQINMARPGRRRDRQEGQEGQEGNGREGKEREATRAETRDPVDLRLLLAPSPIMRPARLVTVARGCGSLAGRGHIAILRGKMPVKRGLGVG